MKRELYRIVEGSQVWTLTSASEAISYNGDTFEPATIGRSEAEVKNELTKANIEVKFDLDNPIARRWMTDRVDSVVTLTLFEEDETSPGTFDATWKGRLASHKPGISDIVLVFESIFTSLRRTGLRARFLRTCRHSLYGRGCLLNMEDFLTTGFVTGITGLVVTVPEADALPDGFFNTGIIEAPDGSMRFITNHVGSQLTLFRRFESLERVFTDLHGWGNNWGNYWSGPGVSLYPGCDRTRQTCNDKFNNLPRYGGFDWIPLRNPYDGSSIV